MLEKKYYILDKTIMWSNVWSNQRLPPVTPMAIHFQYNGDNNNFVDDEHLEAPLVLTWTLAFRLEQMSS